MPSVKPRKIDCHVYLVGDGRSGSTCWLRMRSAAHRLTARVIVHEAGLPLREVGKRCGIGDSAALMLKLRICADLLEFFGEETTSRLLHGVSPNWESDLRTSRDRTHHTHVISSGKTEASPRLV